MEPSHGASANRIADETFGPVPLTDATKAITLPLDEPLTPISAVDRSMEEEVDNGVDWENLEKTEEQEPRGEGSDDVSDMPKWSL